MIKSLIDRIRRESHELAVLCRALSAVCLKRTVVVFNQFNPGRRFCFSCLKGGYLFVPKVDAAICVLNNWQFCRILYVVSSILSHNRVVQIASDDSSLFFVQRFYSFRLWWNNEEQAEYINCLMTDSAKVRSLFSTDISGRHDLTISFPFFTEQKSGRIGGYNAFDIRKVCYIGAIDVAHVVFAVKDMEFIDAALTYMRSGTDKGGKLAQMSFKQLKNTFRFSVLRYLLSEFGEDYLDIYGSAASVLQYGRKLTVEPGDCEVIYPRYALSLDLLSRVGSSSRYERSVAIVNSGGNLLQAYTYDSDKTFGRLGSHSCTFRSCVELVSLVRSALENPFQYNSNAMRRTYYPSSEDFVDSVLKQCST